MGSGFPVGETWTGAAQPEAFDPAAWDEDNWKPRMVIAIIDINLRCIRLSVDLPPDDGLRKLMTVPSNGDEYKITNLSHYIEST